MRKFILPIIVATIVGVFAFILVSSPAEAGFFSSTPKPATSDAQMSKSVEMQNKQIDAMVGYPSLPNGFEKRQVRLVYELRDNPEYRTWSYIVTLDGNFVFICNSVGYGINASIQFSNPEKVVRNDNASRTSGTFATMPQAEPNGLYMPEGLAATYVMCVDGEELKPVYIESDVLVSPFEMKLQ